MRQPTAFGRAVKIARIDTGTTLEELARFVSYSPAFLSNVEWGRKKVPFGLADSVTQFFKQHGYIFQTNLQALADVSNGYIDLNTVPENKHNILVHSARMENPVFWEKFRALLAI